MTREIAIIHPCPSVRGGAEELCFALIAALLSGDYRITLFTAETHNATYKSLSDALGRDLASRVKLVTPLAIISRILPLRKQPTLLAYAALLRALRWSDFSRFAFVCSTFGECDLVQGSRQVCYIHYPVLHADALSVSRLGGRLEKRSTFRLAYMRLARALSGFRFIPNKALVLTNSNWTKGEITRLLTLRLPVTTIEVVYPPVRQLGAGLSMARKSNSVFSCLVLGRFEAYKRQDVVVRALQHATAKVGRCAEVHFAGRGTESDIVRLHALASEHVKVHVHHNARDDTLRMLTARCHVAASAFRHEHFGMATAELLGTGLPVFVPDGGGQPEVADDARFVFLDQDDLAQRFARVMTGEWSLFDLQTAALRCGCKFADEQFKQRVCEIFGSLTTASDR